MASLGCHLPAYVRIDPESETPPPVSEVNILTLLGWKLYRCATPSLDKSLTFLVGYFFQCIFPLHRASIHTFHFTSHYIKLLSSSITQLYVGVSHLMQVQIHPSRHMNRTTQQLIGSQDSWAEQLQLYAYKVEKVSTLVVFSAPYKL